MTSNNKAADIAFNPKRKFQENEAKVKFMNFKSQNVVFFNSLPHFDCDSPTNEKGKKPENIDSCPTKNFNFFNDVNDCFNRPKNFNSYLFSDK